MPTENPTGYVDRQNNRVVVTGFIHHQSNDDTPTSIEVRFTRKLESDEQVYTRRLKVLVGQPTQLEPGWIQENVGYLVVENTGKVPVTVVCGDFEWNLLPKEVFVGSPAGELPSVSVEEDTAITYHVFPR